MAVEIIVPKVDMVMETGTFVEWLKKEGETVQKGESLFVILTDKATIECEAPASGVLAGLAASPDDVIPVTQVIGYILAPGEALPTASAAAAAPAASQAATLATPAQPAHATVQASPPGKPGPVADKLVRATPVARAMAREKGIDLALISGRGPAGRIYQADVQAYLSQAGAAAATTYLRATAVASTPGSAELNIPLPNARILERIPVKGVRAIVARRMAYSAATAPHIYLGLHVDMSEVIRLRTQIGPVIESRHGFKLSYTAILAYVVARILPSHPYLNSSLDGEEIILWDDVHLGIATALGNDLVVPVVRSAQLLSLENLALEMNRLLEAARSRKLEPSELSGSTFTISNLGMFGIEDFTAIINPPESSILAVGKMVDRVEVVNGQFASRPTIHLTLATDHRINDGLRAATFMGQLKSSLENPYILL